MRAPSDSDSSGKVMQLSMRIAARINGEKEVAALTGATLSGRLRLRDAIKARNLAEDDTFVAEGLLSAAERHTDRKLVLFGQRLESALGTVDVPGKKNPFFLFVFNKKAPSSLLPARDTRLETLEKLEKRVCNEAFAGPVAKREFGEVKKAMLAEARAVAVVKEKAEALELALHIEYRARVEVVVAVRAMANSVQSYYAEHPSTARRVLGYANGTATRRKNAAAKLAQEAEQAKKTAQAKEAEQKQAPPETPLEPGPVASGAEVLAQATQAAALSAMPTAKV